MSKCFNSHVKELAINYYLKSFQLDFEKRVSPLSSSSSDKENEDSVSHGRPYCCRCRENSILENRRILERKKKQEIAKQSNAPLSDEENGEPSEFEPSATDWEPSDENPSDSEFEVETRLRRLNTSKAGCKKGQCKPTTPSILTPSNQDNTVVRRRNTRKQAAPKHFISPNKEEPLVFVPLPPVNANIIGTTRLHILPNGKRVHILPNSTKPVPPKSSKAVEPNITEPVQPKTRNSVPRRNTKPVSRRNTKPLPRRNTKPVPRRNRKPVTRRNTKPVPLNNTKQDPHKPTKPIPHNTTNQVTTSSTKQEKNDQNHVSSSNKNTVFTETNSNNNQRKRKYQSTQTDAPQQNAVGVRKIKKETETQTTTEDKTEETNANNKNISDTLDKDTKPKTQHIKKQPEGEKQNVVNKNVFKKNKKPLNIYRCKNKQIKKYPRMINVIMNVDKYLEFRYAVRKIYKAYDASLNLLPKSKQKELRLKKLEKFYRSQWIEIQKELLPKRKEIEKCTNDVGPENDSDVNADNEILDDFDRSDDNILISNKFENINTPKETTNKTDNWVAIGSGKTLLEKEKFRKIKWNSYTVATRGLLLAAFPRRVLATHSMTGKRSPAFLNKPAKMCLDPKKVSDIIIEVSDRFKIRENLIRSVITTKCADESKMFKMRMQKREREAAAKEQNTKKKSTVAA